MTPGAEKPPASCGIFLFERVYNVCSRVCPETERARQVLRRLYDYFLKHRGIAGRKYLCCTAILMAGRD